MKYTTERFIQKATEMHGDKYDYSLANYINSKIPMKIICKEHGIFETTAQCHIRKNPAGCPKCSHTSKNDTEGFIKKSKEVHGNKYDYSLVDYKNNNTKVKIICPSHGEFEQLPRIHASGFNCPKCRYIDRGKKCKIQKEKKSYKLDTKSFIKKAKKIHGEIYDYSLVDYKNIRTKIKIICKTHGEFEQKAFDHLRKSECPKCAINISRGKLINELDYFLKKCKEKHKNKYDYSKVEYKGSNDKIKIKCKKHGYFTQRAHSHTSGQGCPKCKESKGEIIIREYLKSNKIRFIPQKKFKNCRNILQLSFDFYISSLKTLIEFNGKQHYEAIEIFGGEDKFKIQKENDKIKKLFAKNNGYKLIVISYKQIKNIEKILKKKLNLL
jgi:very-short-patch-repair endonuclease